MEGEAMRIVDVATIRRDGAEWGQVGLDSGRLVTIDGGSRAAELPSVVAGRVVADHVPRNKAGGVVVDGVRWDWDYS
jgi:hypothetical protein